ncbi:MULTISPECIES: glycosyltransferase [Peribacillus]|uniref:glycosyltransferase n=1 Tax=Peribacillus TaxID=2675229 RepID=UPI0010713293|nr:glycosyltransferase [Peribacillus frigoritolerans]MEC0298328.1 glycosyltransferase [Peribacillus castrilensis]MEC0344042.1 glycosyltransferase [Peribacillus castrilensis]TFH63827.1 glycosyltransferase [Peribacillus frigoritolerans]
MFVLPSLSLFILRKILFIIIVEVAPFALLEAMSCKCPVLTTDSDGEGSPIIHNQTGK